MILGKVESGKLSKGESLLLMPNKVIHILHYVFIRCANTLKIVFCISLLWLLYPIDLVLKAYIVKQPRRRKLYILYEIHVS